MTVLGNLSIAAMAMISAFAAVGATAAYAQDEYPSQTIEIVNPYSAGGGLDLHLRALEPVLEELLDTSIAIVNRPGGAGGVGLQSVAEAPADGYTIAATTVAVITVPEVDALFGRPQGFTTDTFAPIALLSAEPLLLVVNSNSPWESLEDFVNDARSGDEAIRYSSAGVYGPSHLATELFAGAADIDLRHIPYQGSAPSLNALLGEHVELYLTPPSIAVPHLESGSIRALAVTSGDRHVDFPDVETLTEQGVDAEFYNWYGLLMHGDTPEDRLETVRQAIANAVRDERFVGAMAQIDTPIRYMSAEEFASFIEDEAETLRGVLNRIGQEETSE